MRSLVHWLLAAILAVAATAAGGQAASPGQAAYEEGVAQHKLALQMFEAKKYAEGNEARAKGIAAYERAVASDPKLFWGFVNLGDLRRVNATGQENYLKAINDYRKALALKPDEVDLYNRIGLSYWSIGKASESIASIEQAVRLSPKTPGYLYNLGFQYAETGRIAEARQAHTRLQALDATKAQQLLEKIQKTTGESSFIGRPMTWSNPKIELVWIKPGSFRMGKSGDLYEQGRPVTIKKGFYMGKYPVTQAQWRAVMGDDPSFFKKCGDLCPVEQVSWFDAQAFVARLNQLKDGYRYRLPTEAEWEFAYRGGTKGYWYADGDIGWHSGNSGNETHPVGQKPPNAYGLYDMDGLVYEWCTDWYTESGGSVDGSAITAGNQPRIRVLRGRSFYVMNLLGSSIRRVSGPVDEVSRNNGFRVVAEKAGGN